MVVTSIVVVTCVILVSFVSQLSCDMLPTIVQIILLHVDIVVSWCFLIIVVLINGSSLSTCAMYMFPFIFLPHYQYSFFSFS